MDNDIDQKLKSLQSQIDLLRQRRVSQLNIIPQAIKNRHMGEANSYINAGLANQLPESGFQTGVSTSVFFALDTNTLYIWNGDAWVSEVLT